MVAVRWLRSTTLFTVALFVLCFTASANRHSQVLHIDSQVLIGGLIKDFEKKNIHKEKEKIIDGILGLLSVPVTTNQPNIRSPKIDSSFRRINSHLLANSASRKPSPNHFATSPCDHSMSDFLARCVFEDHAAP